MDPNREDGQWRLLNPLSIHFSQPRISPFFRDGRHTEDTALEIVMRHPEKRGSPDESSDVEPSYDILLIPPFPTVRVISWRPKIRSPSGDVERDAFGCVKYGQRNWFALDNRRLYSLQHVAAKQWPRRCCVVVRCLDEVPGTSEREVRKFRTTTEGRTVEIGRSHEPSITWAWKTSIPKEKSGGELELDDDSCDDSWDAQEWAPQAVQAASVLSASELKRDSDRKDNHKNGGEKEVFQGAQVLQNMNLYTTIDSNSSKTDAADTCSTVTSTPDVTPHGDFNSMAAVAEPQAIQVDSSFQNAAGAEASLMEEMALQRLLQSVEHYGSLTSCLFNAEPAPLPKMNLGQRKMQNMDPGSLFGAELTPMQKMILEQTKMQHLSQRGMIPGMIDEESAFMQKMISGQRKVQNMHPFGMLDPDLAAMQCMNLGQRKMQNENPFSAISADLTPMQRMILEQRRMRNVDPRGTTGTQQAQSQKPNLSGYMARNAGTPHDGGTFNHNSELPWPELISCPMSGWQYVDPDGRVQGPFTLQKMRVWHEYGYFVDDLPMRCRHTDSFVPFCKIFPEPLEPFKDFVLTMNQVCSALLANKGVRQGDALVTDVRSRMC